MIRETISYTYINLTNKTVKIIYKLNLYIHFVTRCIQNIIKILSRFINDCLNIFLL